MEDQFEKIGMTDMDNENEFERILKRIDLMLDDIKRESENPYLTKAFAKCVTALASIYETRIQWLIEKNKWNSLKQIRRVE